MSHPVLTLAIPNWNGARYLEATLASLAANRPFVRWYLQDAASSDDSVAIAQRWAGPEDRICVEPDNGQADGLNRAFARMGGDLVGFLNSDDCMAPGAAKAILDTFAARPDVDIVYGEIEWIDEHGRITGHHRGRLDSYADVVDVYRFWWQQRQWVQPEVFWRRSLGDRVGPFEASLHLAFDYQYWVRCFLAGCTVQRIPQVLSQFRKHAAQKSTQAQRAASEIRRTVQWALEQRPIDPPARDRAVRLLLEYDSYHHREPFSRVPVEWGFARALLANPQWIQIPNVRDRLWRSLVRR